MMASSNKATLLRRHDENAFLNTPVPPFMSRSHQDLSVSQPQVTMDEAVVKAATQALRDGQTHYVDVPGIGPLREAFAAYLQEAYGAAYESNHVLVTAGVQESRFLTLQKVGEQFEQIAIPAVVHPGVRRALGTRPRSVSEIAVGEENGYLPTVEVIHQRLESGFRLLYLESPSRLTGKVYSAEEVAALNALLQEFDAGLIVDQGLAAWVANDEYRSFAAGQGAVERVAVLGEAWPGMGLNSWFIGFIATPQKWFEPMRSQKQIMAICTSTASQYAALEAGQHFQERHTAHLAQLAHNRSRAADLARKAGLVPLPGEANAVMAVPVTGVNSKVQETLRQAGYDVADGAVFGADGILRLSTTLDETTSMALRSLN
jgi:arginine:pyruvate transaminase